MNLDSGSLFDLLSSSRQSSRRLCLVTSGFEAETCDFGRLKFPEIFVLFCAFGGRLRSSLRVSPNDGEFDARTVFIVKC